MRTKEYEEISDYHIPMEQANYFLKKWSDDYEVYYNEGYNAIILIEKLSSNKVGNVEVFELFNGFLWHLNQYTTQRIRTKGQYISEYPRVTFIATKKEQGVHIMVMYITNKAEWKKRKDLQLEIDHIDNNHYNSHPSNLQFLTHEENTAKQIAYGKDKREQQFKDWVQSEMMI